MSSSVAKNFFGLSGAGAGRDSSRVAIVPVPFEGASATAKGAKDGPKAVLEASQNIQLFDDELWVEPYKIGVHTTAAVKMAPLTPETDSPFQELTDVVRSLVDGDKFPIIVGGDPAISLGSVRACVDRYPNLSILHLGAHCQMRASVDGDEYSPASTAYQNYKALPKASMTQVGVRSVSWQEVAWMEEDEPHINIFWGRNQAKWDYNEIVGTLSENVYLSVNLDVLDPSCMPATALPEPGGIDWQQLIDLIKLTCVRKNIVCAEITGLSPIKGMAGPNVLAAKLMYKLIGYRFALDLGVTKKYL